MKKVLSMLLVVMLVFSGTSVLAAKKEKGEMFLNGDMELLGTVGSFYDDAMINKVTSGVNHSIVHGGNQSLKLSQSNPEIKEIMVQKVEGFISGGKYNFSAWVYAEELLPTSVPTIKFEFKDEAGANVNYILNVDIDAQIGKWKKVEMEFFAEPGTSWANVHLRLDGGGTIYWDDVSLIGESTPENLQRVQSQQKYAEEAAAISKKYQQQEQDLITNAKPIEGSPEVLKNNSFEESDGGNGASDWNSMGGNEKWGNTCTIVTEAAHSGEKSLLINADPAVHAYPYAAQQVTENFETGRDYLISAWVKIKEAAPLKGAIMKIECYSDVYNRTSVTATGSFMSPSYSFTDGEWHQIKMITQIPDNTKVMVVLFRFESPGQCYVDDVSLRLAEVDGILGISSYRIFYYSDIDTIDMYADINNSGQAIPVENMVEFKVSDGDNVLYTDTKPARRRVKFEFDSSVLAEKKKPYTASVTYKAADGTVIEGPKEKTIYKYDRPKALDKDGNYIDTNGEKLNMYLAYGPSPDYMDVAKELGVTIMRSWFGNINSDEKIQEGLDLAQSNGIKVAVSLYDGGNIPAGHPMRIDRVREIVTKFKDHPAVYAWMLMDEPSLHPAPGNPVKTYDEMLKYLTDGYIAIREIDDFHPVYCLESTSGGLKGLKETSQRTDIFVTDPYMSVHSSVPTFGTLRTTQAIEYSGNTVPVGILLAAGKMIGHEWPTDVEYRHMVYQAYWNGAVGSGYIPLISGSGYKLVESPYYDGILRFSKSGEKDIIAEHFTEGSSTLFSNYQGKDYWSRVWMDKNGQMYMVLMNIKTEDTKVDFELVSENGRVSIDGYDAIAVNGGESFSSDTNKVELTLGDIQVALYKLQPKNTVNINEVTLPAYTDLEGYDWAQSQINELSMLDILNSKGDGMFAPGEKITRADFAYFLVRTLGLTGKATDNFSDVDPNAYYAKELAIGKEHGLLKGQGDNMYSPDEEITRQDVMVICARGMRKTGILSGLFDEAILNTYSDNGLIADYAKTDISAMTSEEIVLGNSDGSLNPLGNTTRAEAAVIMHRIYKVLPKATRLLGR